MASFHNPGKLCTLENLSCAQTLRRKTSPGTIPHFFAQLPCAGPGNRFILFNIFADSGTWKLGLSKGRGPANLLFAWISLPGGWESNCMCPSKPKARKVDVILICSNPVDAIFLGSWSNVHVSLAANNSVKQNSKETMRTFVSR